MTQRRRILSEARILMSFILRRSAPPHLLRRYARALEAGRRSPLDLPRWLAAAPALVGLIEPFGKPRGDFAAQLTDRLGMALLLCETDPAGAALFVNDGRLSRLAACRSALSGLIAESAMLPVRLVLKYIPIRS